MLTDGSKVLSSLMLSRDASRVKRFHTMPMISENTVGQHTFNVIGILLICIPPAALRPQLVAAAWQHDVPEAVVGDIPSPAKRAIRESGGDVDAAERKVLTDHGMHEMSGYLYEYEVEWLKMADNLEGWMRCVEEMRMGNQLIRPAARNFRRYASAQMQNLRIMPVGKAVSYEDEQRILQRFEQVFNHTMLAHKEIFEGDV